MIADERCDILLLLLLNKRCDKYSGEDRKCMAKVADGGPCNEQGDCKSGKCWNPLSKFGKCGFSNNTGKRLNDGYRCNDNSDCVNGR